jgi:hypothetical protein
MTDTDSDVVAITQLVNLSGPAVDCQRWQLFDRIFTADVDADYGATSHWMDREQFKGDFAAFHAPFDSTQHTMSTQRGPRRRGPGAQLLQRRLAPAAQGRRRQPSLGPHRLVRRHPFAHPRRLADHAPGVPHHLVDRLSARRRNDPGGEVRTGHVLRRAADAGRVGVLATIGG